MEYVNLVQTMKHTIHNIRDCIQGDHITVYPPEIEKRIKDRIGESQPPAVHQPRIDQNQKARIG
jgi:hypothetical protein